MADKREVMVHWILGQALRHAFRIVVGKKAVRFNQHGLRIDHVHQRASGLVRTPEWAVPDLRRTETRRALEESRDAQGILASTRAQRSRGIFLRGDGVGMADQEELHAGATRRTQEVRDNQKPQRVQPCGGRSCVPRSAFELARWLRRPCTVRRSARSAKGFARHA